MILTACWQNEPENRPTFATLCAVIAAETGLGLSSVHFNTERVSIRHFFLKVLNEFTDSRGSEPRTSKKSDAKSSSQTGSEHYAAIMTARSSNV
jgi:hypothetical protein